MLQCASQQCEPPTLGEADKCEEKGQEEYTGRHTIGSW